MIIPKSTIDLPVLAVDIAIATPTAVTLGAAPIIAYCGMWESFWAIASQTLAKFPKNRQKLVNLAEFGSINGRHD
ncbi:hypothetical protein [Microcoleus sp. herbarium12]|uniref:hypothetical protein n=1 Tax=Microcoleus sp. herbarium12 TaxID=3055437 RepID=UPI002FD665A7